MRGNTRSQPTDVVAILQDIQDRLARAEFQDYWHEVGAADEPAMAANWSEADGTNYPVRFVRDREGWVDLEGKARWTGTNTTGAESHAQTVFTLPVGWRPAKAVISPWLSGYNTGAAVNIVCSAEVTAAGLVVLRYAADLNAVARNPTDFVSLSGVRFRAA